jgi:hypothetical protein
MSRKLLTYGSIIKIIDVDKKFQDNIFFVQNISSSSLELIQNNGLHKQVFEIDEGGSIIDHNIIQVIILHQPKQGYAKLNKLLPGKFIKIIFNDENELLGKIFFLEEDMIGIKLNDKDKTKIYIDFHYCGLDESYNIKEFIFIDEETYNGVEHNEEYINVDNQEEYDEGFLVYNIEQQVDDYAEQMIKTKQDKKKVENEIEKYKHLLDIYTNLDEGIAHIKLSENQLKNCIYNMNKNLLVPVTSYGYKHLFANPETINADDINYEQLQQQYTIDESLENNVYSVIMHDDQYSKVEISEIMDGLRNPDDYLQNVLLYNVKRKPEHKKIRLLQDTPVALIDYNEDSAFEMNHVSFCNGKISQNIYSIENLDKDTKMILNGVMFRPLAEISHNMNQNVASLLMEKMNVMKPSRSSKVHIIKNKLRSSSFIRSNICSYLPIDPRDDEFKTYVGTMNISLSNILQKINPNDVFSIYKLRNKLGSLDIEDLNEDDYNELKKYTLKNIKNVKEKIMKFRREQNKQQISSAEYNKIQDFMLAFIQNNYVKSNIPYTRDELYNFIDIDNGSLFYFHLMKLTKDLNINISNQEIMDLVDSMKRDIEINHEALQQENKTYGVVKVYATLKDMENDNQKQIILRDTEKDKKLNNIKYLHASLVSDYKYTESIEVFASKLEEILYNYKLDQPEHEDNVKLGKQLFDDNESLFIGLMTNIIDIKVRKNEKCVVSQLANKQYVYDGKKWVSVDKHQERVKKRRILRAKNSQEEFDELKVTILNDYLHNLLSDFEKEKEKENETRDLEMFQKKSEQYKIDLLLNKNNKISKVLKYNKQKVIMATKFINSGYLSHVQFSPLLPLFNMIIGIDDLDRKYNLIMKFVKLFTHDLNDPHWYYCTLSNTKLMPKFFHELAKSYLIYDTHDESIKYFCLKEGSLSDNGDAWVHSKTGYIIQKIEFDTNYGYDDAGFKIVLDALEKDIHDLDEEVLFGSYTLKDIISEDSTGDMKIKKDVILNQEENTIYHFMVSISSKMNFSFMHEHNKKVLSKEIYKIANFSTKYSRYFHNNKDEARLLSIMCFILVYIQCHNVIVEKSVLGCIQSFEGFPLSQNENENKGLIYIACVLYTLCNKNQSPPYNVYSRSSKPDILESLTNFMKDFVLQNSFVTNMLMEKRHKSQIDEFHQSEYQILIKNPQLFKPSLYQLDVPDPSEFENKKNIADLLVLVNKNIEQYIQTFIQKETPIITSKYEEPYLINYCCNNSDFILNHLTNEPKHKKIMFDLLKQSESLERQLSKRLIYNNTSIPKSVDSQYNSMVSDKKDSYDEMIVYLYIITKCNFDNNKPIPSNLLSYVPEKPGSWYKPSIPGSWHTKNAESDKLFKILKEKITILKEHGFNYENGILYNIMSAVNENHIEKEQEQKEEKPKSEKYDEFILAYNPEMKEDELLENFNSDIVAYKSQCAKLINSETTRLFERINYIIGQFDSQETHQGRRQYIDFLYNMNYALINIIPQFLLNKKYNKEKVCMKHWNIAPAHVKDIQSIHENHINYIDTIELIDEYKELFKFNLHQYKDILDYQGFVSNPYIQFTFMSSLFYEVLSNYTLGHILSGDDPKMVPVSETYKSILQYLNHSLSSLCLDYSSITKKYNQSKNSEKKLKTDRLKKMKKQQRDVEKNLMALKLGEWSYGTDKRVFKYVKDYYEKEKETADNIKSMMNTLYSDESQDIIHHDTMMQDLILDGQDDPRLLCATDDVYEDENGEELDGDEYY